MEHSEPMMLGSPVGNPGHISPAGNQFLPGYLMGDPTITTTPVLNRSKPAHPPTNLYGSPGLHYHGSPAPPTGITSRTSPNSQKLTLRSPKNVNFSNVSTSKERVGAPPVATLMEDFGNLDGNTGKMSDTFSRSFAVNDSHKSFHPVPGTPNTPNNTWGQKCISPPSPAQIDPFYTQGEALTPDVKLDDTWVTVFGFPPSSASFVLQRFSQYGSILHHQMAADNGNWMHIHYESRLQVKKAMSRNGKVVGTNVMIGVVPCIDVEIMSRFNERTPLKPMSNNTPLTHPSISRISTPTTPKPPSIRPLTAAYNASTSDTKVVSETRTPQKTSGLVTKAMDYLFG
uniref:nucleoporin NUP35-like isoform X1 n=1 Tax=Ciona intestinalis TaxID=7719 RepID=UPI0000523810|nr:nucleoporin NUP35-like isoform X1 [Ciona intestinalis]|eukprot:XP_002128577.1 nucleoporin NUP35-like isoform X1 [Ciona intestinalis]